MDRGAWRARVLGVAKSQTLLSNWTCMHTGSTGITNLVGMGVRLEVVRAIWLCFLVSLLNCLGPWKVRGVICLTPNTSILAAVISPVSLGKTESSVGITGVALPAWTPWASQQNRNLLCAGPGAQQGRRQTVYVLPWT